MPDKVVSVPGVGNVSFPDSMSDDQIAVAIKTNYPQLSKGNGVQGAGPHDAVVSKTPSLLSIPGLKSAAYNALDATTNALPAAGGMLGGIIGAGGGTLAEPGGGSVLGGIGGAGIGGMAGEAARQYIRKVTGRDEAGSSNQVASDIAKQGAIQGAVQASGEALRPLSGILKKAAATQYERVLAPTTQANKYIAKQVVPGLLDRGVVAGSREGLENRAASEAAALRPKLDAAYDAIPSKAPDTNYFQRAMGEIAPGKQPTELSAMDLGAVAQRAQELKNTAQKMGVPGVLDTLEKQKSRYLVDGKVANPEAVKAIDGVQDIVRQFGTDTTPQSLRKLKAIFDEPVAKRGAYAGADITAQYSLEAKEAAANSIRDILHQASPDAARLDKEVHFWLNVQRVIGDTNQRMAGQSGGLLKVLAPLGAGVAGGMGLASHGATASAEAAATATAVAATVQMVRSPAWRTLSAVAKDRLAESLATGNAVDVLRTAARLGLAPKGSQFGGAPTQGQSAGIGPF